MNFLKTMIGALILAASFSASADSMYLDSERMYSCGGSIQLREAYNGDLALVLRGNQCSHLRFYDVTSGRTIKEYYVQGTSFTLSNSMLRSLSSDCRLGLTLSGGGRERFEVVSGWCRRNLFTAPVPRYDYDRHNRSDRYDRYDRGPRVTYEWSSKGNCKKMINGQFSGDLVPKSFCY